MRIVVLTVAAVCFGQFGAGAQTARTADTLSPKDIGAVKYVFEVVPKEGEVVVFRCDLYVNDKLKECDDTLYGVSKPGEPVIKQVVLIDGGFFRYFDGKYDSGPYSLKYPDGGARLDDCKLIRWGDTGKDAKELVFKYKYKDGSEDTRRMVYSISTEPYASLKETYPDLPPEKEFQNMVTRKEKQF